MQRLVRSSSGFIAITKDSRNIAEVVSLWGEITDESSFAPSECCALRGGRLVVSRRAEAIVKCAHATVAAASLGKTVCIPLVAQGEALGVMHVHIPNEVMPLVTSEFSTLPELPGDPVKLLSDVTAQCASALASLRLREQLQRQSIRDPLTGAFNRRYLETSLERELSRATRRDQSVGVMMLDVDHFKQFNDRFGHDAGDTVLCELAAQMHSLVRNEDIVCRYGGEEFAIVVPEVSMDVLRDRAEALLARIRDVKVDQRGQIIGPVSASIGIALFPSHGDAPAELLKAADRALYRAKELGRDRVEVAPWLTVHRPGESVSAAR